jgi:glutathione synthase/RimK-type ligase-like ATP-grasp enzyme
MRAWVLVPNEPLTDDRAYLLGHLKGVFDDIETAFVDRHAERAPAPEQRPDLILNLVGGLSQDLLDDLQANAEHLQVPLSPSPAAARRSDDKRTYLQDFRDVSPETRIARDLDEVRSALTDFGAIVVKDPFGMRGKGVERVCSEADLPIASELLANTTNDVAEIIVQPFLSGFARGDKRIIIQRSPNNGFQIIGQLFRKPPPGEWKSGLRSGGQAFRTELTEAEAELALKVAPRTGLDNVTLDIGEHEGKLFYIEHNQGYGGIVDFDLDRGASAVSACGDFLLHLARHGRPS